ncbi:MAG: hypothetical protein KIT11_09540 [Fimbriimonadaceae bacterium]|nr:hypothetical protein [Fimbriimonadaceae bacterium]QYK55570.1 MAG: hypothetical protein KF733_11210 [Fimbriimonadaceae bacterium]
MTPLFGRTNLRLPRTWLRLLPPEGGDQALPEMVEAAVRSGLPLDVTRATSLWGPGLAGAKNATVAFLSPLPPKTSNGGLAADLVGADLFALLACLGRSHLDLCFVGVTGEESVDALDGMFESLEIARQDGLVGSLGLDVAGPPPAVLGQWAGRDGFEAVAMEASGADPSLLKHAKEKRTGVVLCWPSPQGYESGLEMGSVLVPVRSAAEIEGVVRQGVAT